MGLAGLPGPVGGKGPHGPRGPGGQVGREGQMVSEYFGAFVSHLMIIKQNDILGGVSTRIARLDWL